LGRFQRAAVTCDHGICSEIGRDVLLQGGNAIDSAIASLFCLGITNPQSSGQLSQKLMSILWNGLGLGGGFILTFYDAKAKQCRVMDARETAPKASSKEMFGTDEWASKYGRWGIIFYKHSIKIKSN
jgi:gamma-glutamyltranspeptidase / glutathione hydrolase / leukotriene-C4 hydrolase